MKKVFILLTFITVISICNDNLSNFISKIGDGAWNGMRIVHAESSKVQYFYDSLGRLTSAVYPDGTVIEYDYDKNGNIEQVKRTDTTEKESGTTTEEGQSGTTEKSTENKTEEGQGGTTGGGTGTTTGGQSGTTEKDTTVDDDKKKDPSKPSLIHPGKDTEQDKIQYSKFKKKRVVIRSLKKSKKKGKMYLKIKIRQVFKRGTYGEAGYQIKYSTNKKFKKAKTIRVKRSKKGKITAKKWKVKKKTYYVKVRAYMKKKNGKVIYSRYSKAKQITIQ